MRNLIRYEWDWEENELPSLDGDVLEHWFSDKPEPCPDIEGYFKLCLMRSEWNPFDGDCEGQEYLYVIDGELPDEFDNGIPVPKAKKREFQQFVSNGWIKQASGSL